MAKKITWTASTWKDLEEVADYIAKDSPNYAATFVEEVKNAARSLAILSERGRVVPEFDDPNVRELFIKSYRMLYNTTKDRVYILGFIHGARDLLTLRDFEKRIP